MQDSPLNAYLPKLSICTSPLPGKRETETPGYEVIVLGKFVEKKNKKVA